MERQQVTVDDFTTRGTGASWTTPTTTRTNTWYDKSVPTEADLHRAHHTTGGGGRMKKFGTIVIGAACVAMIAVMFFTQWAQTGLFVKLGNLPWWAYAGIATVYLIMVALLYMFLTFERDTKRSTAIWGSIVTSFFILIITATAGVFVYSLVQGLS